jgi:hypothetical protein
MPFAVTLILILIGHIMEINHTGGHFERAKLFEFNTSSLIPYSFQMGELGIVIQIRWYFFLIFNATIVIQGFGFKKALGNVFIPLIVVVVLFKFLVDTLGD